MVGKLFIPGPSEVREAVLGELSRPQIGHRTQEFRELFASLKPGLKKVFFTQNDVLISTSSGSGLWEAASRCCASKKLLHAVNGAFSSKWADVSESCGKEVVRVNFENGKAVKACDVEKALSAGNYEAFFIRIGNPQCFSGFWDCFLVSTCQKETLAGFKDVFCPVFTGGFKIKKDFDFN